MKNITIKFLALGIFSIMILKPLHAQLNLDKYDKYEEVCSSNEKTPYIVSINDKMGVVDFKGKILIPLEYNSIERFETMGIRNAQLCALDPAVQDFLFEVKMGDKSGILNLKNKFIIPLDQWKYLNNDLLNSDSSNLYREFLLATKKGSKTPEYNANSNVYNEYEDTSFLFDRSGNLLFKSIDYYDLKILDIPKCITSDIYFFAEPTGTKNYGYGKRDFFIIENSNAPKLLFTNCDVELAPDKVFYIEQGIIGTIADSVGFYTLKGKKITTNGLYSNITRNATYPRFIAESLEDGLNYIIDQSGNKLSEGFKNDVIIGGRYYDEDGYFYKIYDNFSLTPICKDFSNKITTNTLQKPNALKQINKFEDVKVSVEIDSSGTSYQAYINFDGKRVTPLYNDISDIDSKYFEKGYEYSGYMLKVYLNNKYGLFCLVPKKEILPVKYDDIFVIEDGIYMLELNNKFGIWNQKSNLLIEPIYDKIDNYPTRVKLNGVWGKIEKTIFVPF